MYELTPMGSSLLKLLQELSREEKREEIQVGARSRLALKSIATSPRSAGLAGESLATRKLNYSVGNAAS